MTEPKRWHFVGILKYGGATQWFDHVTTDEKEAKGLLADVAMAFRDGTNPILYIGTAAVNVQAFAVIQAYPLEDQI
jgi:hypothetical protein